METHDTVFAQLEPAHEALMHKFVDIRRPPNSESLAVRAFLSAHVKKAVDRLLGAYAELAVLVPSTHPLDDWLGRAQNELRNYRASLPTRSYVSLVQRAQTPLLSIAAGGTLTVFTFHVAGWCVCILARCVAVLVPIVLAYTAAAFLSARSVLADGEDTASAHSLEVGITRILKLPLRREIPWDIVCLALASAWCFAASSIFVDLVWRVPAPVIGGSVFAVITLYRFYQLVREKGYEPTDL